MTTLYCFAHGTCDVTAGIVTGQYNEAKTILDTDYMKIFIEFYIRYILRDIAPEQDLPDLNL